MSEYANKTTLVVPFETGNGTQGIAQNINSEISAKEQEVREFVQESTQALVETLKSAVQMTAGKDFRIQIEEEVNIIEK